MKETEKQFLAGEGKGNTPFFVSPITLKILKKVLEDGKNKLHNMGKTKGETAADFDKWHDETFREIERQTEVLAIYLAQIAQGLSLEAVNREEGIEIYEPSVDKSVICVGSKVTLFSPDQLSEPFQVVIVGKLDFLLHPKSQPNWATISSPFGLALIGKRVGEEVTVETPSQTLTYIIKEITPANELFEPLEK